MCHSLLKLILCFCCRGCFILNCPEQNERISICSKLDSLSDLCKSSTVVLGRSTSFLKSISWGDPGTGSRSQFSSYSPAIARSKSKRLPCLQGLQPLPIDILLVFFIGDCGTNTDIWVRSFNGHEQTCRTHGRLTGTGRHLNLVACLNLADLPNIRNVSWKCQHLT